MCPYNPLIPQANDRIRDSQPPILENFTVVDRAWNVNHGAFDAGGALALEGKHKWVTFPTQGAAAPATLATEVAVFSGLAITGVTELFFRQQNNGVVYEMTSSANAVEGWSRLASGILIKWGLQAPGTALVGINIDVFPVGPNTAVFAEIYTVFVNGYHVGADAANVRLMDWTVLQFRVFATIPGGGTNPGWTYLAIGR